MGIDEQLISKNTRDSEAEKAGEFREATRGSIPGSVGQEANDVRAVKKQKKDKERIEKRRFQSRATKDTPFRRMTDGWLKSAWTNLIPSWGLTLFYIDIHYFLNKVFGPSAFRELGEEWIPSGLDKVSREKSKSAASLLRIVEGSGCGCMNLGCLFLIIGFLSVVTMIVSVISNPLDNIGAIFGFLWHIIKSI